MAIDLLVLPLSRYWSGDYVLPSMELAWSLGTPYMRMGPEGPREIPPGQPVGGAGAPAARATLARSLRGELARVGVTVSWNEEDAAKLAAWRLDPRGFGAIVEDVRRNCDQDPGWLDRALGKRARRSHLGHANVLVPAVLDAPCAYKGVTLGSLDVAAKELDEIVFGPSADSAIADVKEAVAAARARRLPLVIDT